MGRPRLRHVLSLLLVLGLAIGLWLWLGSGREEAALPEVRGAAETGEGPILVGEAGHVAGLGAAAPFEDEDDLPTLLEGLAGEFGPDAEARLLALAREHPELPAELVAWLAEERDELRPGGMESLSHLKALIATVGAPCVPALRKMLAAESEEDRRRALSTLALVGPAAAPALGELVTLARSEAAPQAVRVMALEALGALEAEASPAAEDIYDLYDRPGLPLLIRARALDAYLRAVGAGEGSLAAMRDALASERRGLVRVALEGAFRQGPAARPLLDELLLLLTEEPEQQELILAVIGSIGVESGEVLAALTALLEEAEHPGGVAGVLAGLGPAGRQRLITLMRRTDRPNLVTVLGQALVSFDLTLAERDAVAKAFLASTLPAAGHGDDHFFEQDYFGATVLTRLGARVEILLPWIEARREVWEIDGALDDAVSILCGCREHTPETRAPILARLDDERVTRRIGVLGSIKGALMRDEIVLQRLLAYTPELDARWGALEAGLHANALASHAPYEAARVLPLLREELKRCVATPMNGPGQPGPSATYPSPELLAALIRYGKAARPLLPEVTALVRAFKEESGPLAARLREALQAIGED